MRLLFKLGLFAVFIGSILLALLLCGVFADAFTLPFPRRVLAGIVGSVLMLGLISLAAGLCLFSRKQKCDYAAGPSFPEKTNDPKQ